MTYSFLFRILMALSEIRPLYSVTVVNIWIQVLLNKVYRPRWNSQWNFISKIGFDHWLIPLFQICHKRFFFILTGTSFLEQKSLINNLTTLRKTVCFKIHIGRFWYEWHMKFIRQWQPSYYDNSFSCCYRQHNYMTDFRSSNKSEM